MRQCLLVIRRRWVSFRVDFRLWLFSVKEWIDARF